MFTYETMVIVDSHGLDGFVYLYFYVLTWQM